MSNSDQYTPRIFVIVSVLARCRLIMSKGTLGADAWTNADTILLASHCEQYAKEHPNEELKLKQLEYESLTNLATGEPRPESPFSKFKSSTLSSKIRSYYNSLKKQGDVTFHICNKNSHVL